MDRHADPVATLNTYAADHHWPFRGSAVLDFEQPALNRLRDLWQLRRNGPRPPARSDFDLRALKPVLTNLLIVERIQDAGRRRFRIRLMGTELVRLTGEGTGRFLDENLPADVLAHWNFVFDTVLGDQVPLRFITQFSAQRVSYLTSESLVAPLLDGAGEPTLVMVCAFFHSKAERPSPEEAA